MMFCGRGASTAQVLVREVEDHLVVGVRGAQFVMKPLTMPKTVLQHLGKRRDGSFVVHDAFADDVVLVVVRNRRRSTPRTKVPSSPFAGAEMMDLLRHRR